MYGSVGFTNCYAGCLWAHRFLHRSLKRGVATLARDNISSLNFTSASMPQFTAFHILLLCFILSPTFAKARECGAFALKRSIKLEESRITLYGRKLDVHRIPSSELQQNTLTTSKLPFRNSIYIGIREDGHMYVVTPSMRYDGEIVYFPPDVRESSILSSGFVMRLEDESGQLAADVEKVLRSGLAPAGLSCGHGACRLIRTATGTEVFAENIPAVFSPTFLKRAVQSGFKDRNGQPIKMQMLILGDASPQRILMSIRGATAIRITAIGLFTSYFTGVSSALGALLLF